MPRPIPPRPVNPKVIPKKAAKKPVKRSKKGPSLAHRMAEVKTLIEGHLEHTQAKDTKAYLSDFVPRHPRRKQLEAQAKRIFTDYDLEMVIEDFRITELNRHTAKVLVVQRTHRVPLTDAGYEAQERAAIKYLLRKVNKNWKIESTTRERLDDHEGDK